MRGTVKRVFDRRGYGFLVDESGQERFFSLSEVADGSADGLRSGSRVLFEPRSNPKGPAAIGVRRDLDSLHAVQRDANHRGPESTAASGTGASYARTSGPESSRACSVSSFHLGEGAGKKLYGTIKNARRQVKIVSPYLSVGHLRTLRELQSRGVAVTLVTSTDYEGAIKSPRDRTEAGRLLLHQHTHTDEHKKGRKQTAITLGVIAALAGLAMALVAFGSAAAPAGVGSAGVALVVTAALILFNYAGKSVLYHTYEPAVEGLRIWDARSPNPSLHTKLYVIDESVAYLGSANFTASGFYHNHECLAEFRDPADVATLSRHLDGLYSDGSKPYLSLSVMGSRVYGSSA